MGDAFVFPSEKLLEHHIPSDCTTVDDKKKHIAKWAKEYVAMMKNPKSYKKLTNGDWDFTILVDMVFSFWIVRALDPMHTQYAALCEASIAYTCNCPRFMHYHYCKHALAVGLHFGSVQVPLRFSTVTVGKRKAPAGASLTKRSHCLQVDD